MKIAQTIVDLPLDRTVVKGILSGDEQGWSFECLNLEFLKLFPKGVVHSFSYFGFDSQHYLHRQFQLAVASRLQDILRRPRRSASAQAEEAYAAHGPRRFVIP